MKHRHIYFGTSATERMRISLPEDLWVSVPMVQQPPWTVVGTGQFTDTLTLTGGIAADGTTLLEPGSEKPNWTLRETRLWTSPVN
jgi:hypothetical protein